MESKNVLLMIWEQGILYPHDEWECYGYSEYCGNIPRFAEIRRKEKQDENINDINDYTSVRQL